MKNVVPFCVGICLLIASPTFAQSSKLVHAGPDGKLAYQPYDDQGDTIPDFSNCGYMGGGVRLPDVPTKLTVGPDSSSRDDTARVQAAIERVEAMRPDPNGFRGALLIARGTYHFSGVLHVNVSGVVLRGEGASDNGTVLFATARRQQPLIEILGSGGVAPMRGSEQR